MFLSERELKSMSNWFTAFRQYPCGYRKGSRVYIPVDQEKELIFACVDTPDIYKCEMLMEDWSKDNELTEPEYYEIEMTDYGFILRHHSVTFKGWTLVDYVEDTHFTYEKEVIF